MLIPSDPSLPLQNLTYDDDPGDETSCARVGDQLPSHLASVLNDGDVEAEFEIVPLRRMSDDTPGVYAYFRRIYDNRSKSTKRPNLRATCLLMSCGQYSKRFYGNVYIGRYGRETIGESPGTLRNMDISIDELRWGCTSPDLRTDILRNLGGCSENDDIILPNWIIDCSMENYKDSIQISALASAFEAKSKTVEDASSSDTDDDNDDENDADSSDDTSEDENDKLRNVALCFHCRGPSESLCEGCDGAYFCKEPRPCRKNGWSHQCLCKTWQIYVQNREQLSIFPFEWHKRLMGRECQISDFPYRRYLTNELKVLGTEGGSWWDTEVDGWAAGLSGSARTVDASIRRSYSKGFLLDASLIPPERQVTDEDYTVSGIKRDARGLPILNSWEDYYLLRGLPLASPVALLLTFPLMIYYAVKRYGIVPITVAKMLGRKLRIHAVGIEKEMNFLDLFKELACLLPPDLEMELTFVVRGDMLPPKCRNLQGAKGYDMKVDLTSNLTLLIKSGTYGEELDPLFGDVGSGPPDMLVGLNAGLFAYKSWSSVVTFCHDNPNVVAVFTDYNEHSGMNCASLGGGKARESLSVNPFRQPLAMPVFCMNLPQFSNCFVYVFNEQELDDE